MVGGFEGVARLQFGVDLRQDLLAHLGPKLAFFAQAASDQGPHQNPAAAMLRQFGGYTLSVQVRDQAAVAKALERVVKGTNEFLKAQGEAARRNPGVGAPAPPGPITASSLVPKPAYVFDFPPGPQSRSSRRCFSRPSCSAKGRLSCSAATNRRVERAAGRRPALAACRGDCFAWCGGSRTPCVLDRQRSPRLVPAFIESLPVVVQQLNAMLSRPSRRPARRPAAPSAPTTSSRSPWRCTTTNRANDAFPKPGDHRQGRQAALELAGGDPALPRAAGALQQVQAGRALGQPAQQGAAQGDAADVRLPEPEPRSSRARRPTGCSRATAPLFERWQGTCGSPTSPTGRPTRSWSSRPRRRCPGPSPTT